MPYQQSTGNAVTLMDTQSSIKISNYDKQTWFNKGVTESFLLSMIRRTGVESVFLKSNREASFVITSWNETGFAC